MILGAVAAAAAGLAIYVVAYSPGPMNVAGQTVATPPQPDKGDAGLPVRFDKAVNFSNNTLDSVYGQVVAEDNNVFVVWEESVPSTGSAQGQYTSRNYDIFVKRSVDNGTTFGSPVNLSNNTGFSEHPQAAVSNGSVYFAWADNTSGNREISFIAGRDNGSSYTQVRTLSNILNTTAIANTTNANSPATDSSNVELAVSGNDVYVVWLEEAVDDSLHVVMRASHDGGETFEKAVVISDKANTATLPKIAADGSAVHVVWSLIGDEQENSLFYSASADNGLHFTIPKKLSDQNDFGEPQVAARNNTVYVISGGLDVIEVNGLFLAKSFDGGASFSSEIADVNGSFVNPVNTELVLDGSAPLIYVAGEVFQSNDEEILLLPLLIGQNSTVPLGLLNLSDNAKVSECPSIAISGDRIFVVWEDLSPGNHEILYARGMKI
jgi:hypothetical protein